MALTIITNNHPREIIYACMLTESERKEFDYIDWQAVDDGKESHDFVMYKGNLHDLGEFDYVRGGYNNLGFEKWDGIMTDSFFSGMLIRYTEDHEVVCGRYFA